MKATLVRMIILLILISTTACDGILEDSVEPFRYMWTKTFSGNDSENDRVTIIDTLADHSGNVFIFGCFSESADFNPGPETDIRDCIGTSNAFLTMIKTNGNYGWTIILSGTDASSYSSITSCSIDYEDNIYLAGLFNGGIDFNPTQTADVRNSSRNTDCFLTKLSMNGNYSWTKVFSGTADFDHYPHVKSDILRNVYLCGDFRGSTDFDPSSNNDPKSSRGNRDVFLTKINMDGSYGGTMTIGGIYDETPNGISVDPCGNIYITGEFTGTVDFNPLTAVDEKTSIGSHNIFLTRINANKEYNWTKIFNASTAIFSGNISTDTEGNIFISGQFKGTADFNPDPEFDIISSSNLDFFLTKINSDGSYGWTSCIKTLFVQGQPYDRIFHNSLITDIEGNIYLCGSFTGVADFDPGPEEDIQIAGDGFALFCTRINRNGKYNWSLSLDGFINYSNISIDNNRNLYIAGFFYSYTDFNPGLHSDVRNSTGISDGFLVKLSQPR